MGICKALGVLVASAVALFLAAAYYYGGLDSAFLQIMPWVPSHWFQNYGGYLGEVSRHMHAY